MKSRKLFTILFTMLVLFVFVAPTMAKATEPNLNTTRTTNVTIHKMELFDKEEVPGTLVKDHDGTLMGTAELNAALGAGNYAGLKGVTFNYWKVNSGDTIDYLNSLDDTELDEDYDEFTTIATDDDGIVTLPPLNDGYYFFKEASTPEIVTEQIAVPFLLGLPVMKADGRSFIKDLHIYPKNLTVRGAVVLTKIAGDEKLPEVTFDLYKGVPSTGALRTTGLETNAQGEIIINNLPVGSYYFVETETVSPYLLDETPIKFTIAANGKATVEAGLRTGQNGDVKFVTHDNYIEPKVDKSIGASGTDKLSADFNEVFDFILELDLPADINQYTKLEVLDTLDDKLDYEGGLVVEGSTDGTNYTALTSPGYFTATELVGNRILKVAFVPTALKSGTVNFTDIRITFKASINEDAIMGKGILNEAFVDYNNGYVTGTHKSPEVFAFTGGKNFIKVNGENLALVGAEFAVKNAEEKFLMVDPETGAYTWVDTLEDTSFRLTSSSDPETLGLFSIKGLKYDLTDGTEYYLYETKAPMSTAGYPYNLIESDIMFLVNGGSYYAEPLEVDEATDAPTAEPQQVINILGPQIPQTGGIGTTLFTMIGGVLMGSAVLLNKKRSRG